MPVEATDLEPDRWQRRVEISIRKDVAGGSMSTRGGRVRCQACVKGNRQSDMYKRECWFGMFASAPSASPRAWDRSDRSERKRKTRPRVDRRGFELSW